MDATKKRAQKLEAKGFRSTSRTARRPVPFTSFGDYDTIDGKNVPAEVTRAPTCSRLFIPSLDAALKRVPLRRRQM